ncbi:hypothetical protein [Paenibacillus sonchi]|uniref:hypothetical protein n=1 Tax=Paenibacillus sonchi TaxID=373687 RepID=UPI001E470703|nr:hypothetical protein [Paenibacillus sonchi]MCE3202451.1 hypothetical protein [Paenibacillus sonchi]
MKFVKKMTTGMVAVAAIFSLAVTAFADTSTTSAPGYGTLTGVLTSFSPYAYYTTTVSHNYDNAYLTIAGSAEDTNGQTIIAKQQVNSIRGQSSFSANSIALPSNTYVVYGTHGVQGGSTYGASAVYTYTHI